MAKDSVSAVICSECGHRSRKWLGRCPDCGNWNSFVDDRGATGRRGRASGLATASAVPLTEVSSEGPDRISSGLADFDRVLGGGLVAGGVALIGGEPGIGKSTLLLQVAALLAERQGPVLYVTGEESDRQVALRAERLGVRPERLLLLVETSVERILDAAEELRPTILVIDSIQTMASEALPTGPGSLGQVRESASRLISWAKARRTPTFLIGHITKDGAIAGPKTLEHAVDTVLYFEGERFQAHRVVRVHKNRFGPVHEIALFEMTDKGLEEVSSPSALLLAERSADAAGAAVLATIEGTRPVLVEVQALVTESRYGNPRRLGVGIDPNRVAILLAVLEKRTGLALGGHDVYVNVAGGLDLDEPATDLAVAAAIVSSFRDRPVGGETVLFGEVGLLGEVRAVGLADQRLREAASFGFRRVVFPAANAGELGRFPDLELAPVRRVDDLVELVSG